MQVGQKVVCVNDSFPPHVVELYEQLPVKGTIYTIRAASLGREKLAVIKDGKLVPNGGSDASVTVRILLEELHNGPDPFCASQELGFNAERFRELEQETHVEELEEHAVGFN
ncbi:hypothetical protein ASA1KI_35420 [Opitutales bacterium ASA1]|jgi:hypothetical protein|nr:hypothetical protein ASA1KI_35420 [Opitutales bacterium ASA1]